MENVIYHKILKLVEFFTICGQLEKMVCSTFGIWAFIGIRNLAYRGVAYPRIAYRGVAYLRIAYRV